MDVGGGCSGSIASESWHQASRSIMNYDGHLCGHIQCNRAGSVRDDMLLDVLVVLVRQEMVGIHRAMHCCTISSAMLGWRGSEYIVP